MLRGWWREDVSDMQTAQDVTGASVAKKKKTAMEMEMGQEKDLLKSKRVAELDWKFERNRYQFQVVLKKSDSKYNSGKNFSSQGKLIVEHVFLERFSV
jgi:hypothetical protein